MPGHYPPSAQVSRAQMATFLIRATNHRTGQQLLTPGADYFADDDGGNVHEDNINATAQGGITAGHPDRAYGPTAPVRRDQMSSYFARTLDLLVEEGYATLPSPQAPEPNLRPAMHRAL